MQPPDKVTSLYVQRQGTAQVKAHTLAYRRFPTGIQVHSKHTRIACALQLRSSVVGQVNEAEAEVEVARAQAEQERQERRAHMETLLAEKAGLDAALQQQRQLSMQLQVWF